MNILLIQHMVHDSRNLRLVQFLFFSAISFFLSAISFFLSRSWSLRQQTALTASLKTPKYDIITVLIF